MKVHPFHSWEVTPREAVKIQERLRIRVIPKGAVKTPKLVAGADCAFDKAADRIYVALVVLSFPGLEPVETVTLSDRLRFPYVPGLLSFREAPALLKAFVKLEHEPDVIFVDGQGLAHPRAAGIACHLGVLLDRPTIGCAKSLLFGTYDEPGASRGSSSSLYDGQGRVIGSVLRTRDRVRPVFVSIGHRINLARAVEIALACGKGYRIPEPTRLADILAERAKREQW
ncbi:MAG: deoxyribonuclease V [Nitrospirota bacterium]